MCFLAYVVPLKRCTKCHESKCWDAFWANPRASDGMHYRCRDCMQPKNYINYQRHQAKRVTAARTRRVTHRARITAQRRAIYAADPERFLAQKKRQYWNNPEKMRLRQRTSRLKHLPKRLLAERLFYAAHKEKWVDWRSKNLDVVRLIASRRRARQRALPDTFTIAERDFMLDYWHHACAICGNQEGFFWTLADDHWCPISSPDCPGTVATNMIPLCHGEGGCNNSKNDSEPIPWLQSRFSSAQAKRILKAVETYFAIVRARQAASAAD